MKIEHKKEDASNSNDDFEYLKYISERLIDVLKLGILIMALVVSISSLLINFIDIGTSIFLDNAFMILGLFFWLVSITSITRLFIMINPALAVNKFTPKEYNEPIRIELGPNNENLDMIWNYLSACLLVMNMSFLLFTFGIFEAGTLTAYDTHLPLGLVIPIISIIFLYSIYLFKIVDSVVSFWRWFKKYKYKYNRWRRDPIMWYRYDWLWMTGFDYRILEQLEEHEKQTIDEISSHLLTREERVQQRMDVLVDKDMIRQSNQHFLISRKGNKFLRGYLMSNEI